MRSMSKVKDIFVLWKKLIHIKPVNQYSLIAYLVLSDAFLSIFESRSF
jgi:hypothetical protein